MFLGSSLLGTDVKEVKIERLPGLDEDEKLLNLFPGSNKKDWEAFEVVDFGKNLGGVYSVFVLEDVLLISAIDVGSVISSTVPFKIVLQATTVDFERFQVLACSVSHQEQVRQQRFFLSWLSSRWLPGLPGRW